MSKNLSAKYYQKNKERLQKKAYKKYIIVWGKMLFCNYLKVS